jgi:DNA polymerase III epsilon subunit-like protein
MRMLVFDTETTGLPETKLMNVDTLDKWPHIVQFSYIIYDTEKKALVKNGIKDSIIKISSNIKISDFSIQLHGITNEISSSEGRDIKEVFTEFFDDILNIDQIVGHNVSFDLNMVRVELLRLIYFKNEQLLHSNDINLYKKFLYTLNNLNNVTCTLQDSIELCNIIAVTKTGKTYQKFPKLVELHKKLFDSEPSNLHNSLNDVLITLRCFMKMKYDTDITIDCDSNMKTIFDKLI